MSDSERLAVARSVAADFAALPQVEAVVLAGSQSNATADLRSDLDVYVYSHAPIDASDRRAIAEARADAPEIDNQFWEPGDEWTDRASGMAVDLIFRTPGWIEDQLDRVLVRHEASVGYSTSLWHSVRTAIPLFDRGSWFGQLQQQATQPYPEPLRRAIIAKNHSILRVARSAYLHQIERAVERSDLVSVQHRSAALLASYFDILFALNRQTHPGEKRLVRLALERCTLVPPQFEVQVQALIRAGASADSGVVAAAAALIDGLDDLLRSEGLRN